MAISAAVGTRDQLSDGGFDFDVNDACAELVVKELEGPHLRRLASAEAVSVSSARMLRRLERFAGRPVAFVDTALPGWAAPHANDELREVRRSTVSYRSA